MPNSTDMKVLTELSNITDEIQKLGSATTADKSLAKILGLLVLVVQNQHETITDLRQKIEQLSRELHNHIGH